MQQYDINDFAYARESRLGEGSIEIGIYIDEILESAGRILVGVITRPTGGSKWFLHGANTPKKAFKTKRAALEEADRVSRETDAYKYFEKQIDYLETKDDWKWENIADNH
jgi:hypothetical protein